MVDYQNEIEALKRRVATLEAKEEVARAMYNWGRWLDRIEQHKQRKDAEHLAHELMTEDGILHMSDPGWGVWGPDKEHIITEFLGFSKAVEWAYHYYFHGEVDVDLDRGTAHFYTGDEYVPLKINGKGQWLFLVQNTDFVKVNGKWRVKQYKLTDLRVVSNGRDDW